MPTVLNAANEIAVQAFLDERDTLYRYRENHSRQHGSNFTADNADSLELILAGRSTSQTGRAIPG